MPVWVVILREEMIWCVRFSKLPGLQNFIYFTEHLSEWCVQKHLLDLAGLRGLTRLFC